MWINSPNQHTRIIPNFSCRRGHSVAGWSFLICTMDQPQTPPIGWIGKEAPLENCYKPRMRKINQKIRFCISFFFFSFLHLASVHTYPSGVPTFTTWLSHRRPVLRLVCAWQTALWLTNPKGFSLKFLNSLGAEVLPSINQFQVDHLCKHVATRGNFMAIPKIIHRSTQ